MNKKINRVCKLTMVDFSERISFIHHDLQFTHDVTSHIAHVSRKNVSLVHSQSASSFHCWREEDYVTNVTESPLLNLDRSIMQPPPSRVVARSRVLLSVTSS